MKNTYFLDAFAGIGGFAYGAWLAGMHFDQHFFSEVGEYAIKVYEKRFPDAINIGDIRKIDYANLPKGKWIVTGGFPCQPHSLAGKRKAGGDERDLWGECARMLRDLRPEYAIFENVTGLFTSDRGRFFNGILSDISASGYDAEWQIISAKDLGAPHLRKRVWIVCYPHRSGCAGKHGRWTGKKSSDGHLQNEAWPVAYPNSVRSSTSKCKKSRERTQPHRGCKDVSNYESAKLQNAADTWRGRSGFADGGIWTVEPDVGRVAHGIPARMDRCKCIGNAIVHQIAAYIFEQIKIAEASP